MTAPSPAVPQPWRIALWISGLIATIGALTLAGGELGAPALTNPSSWPAWAKQRDALTIAFSCLRLGTLVVAWYLLGATTVSVVARVVESARLDTAAGLLTVPAVRRLLQGALGLGVATAAALATAPSAPAPPHAPVAVTMAQPVRDHADMVPLSTDAAVLLPVPTATAPAQPSRTPPRVWHVQPGDHLWSIAERLLSREWHKRPSDSDVTAYWTVLIEENRHRLADPSNPDLLLPGDRLSIPAVPQPPRERD